MTADAGSSRCGLALVRQRQLGFCHRPERRGTSLDLCSFADGRVVDGARGGGYTVMGSDGWYIRVKPQVTIATQQEPAMKPILVNGNCTIYFPVGIEVAAFCQRLGVGELTSAVLSNLKRVGMSPKKEGQQRLPSRSTAQRCRGRCYVCEEARVDLGTVGPTLSKQLGW